MVCEQSNYVCQSSCVNENPLNSPKPAHYPTCLPRSRAYRVRLRLDQPYGRCHKTPAAAALTSSNNQPNVVEGSAARFDWAGKL